MSNWYQNHSQNIILNSAHQVVKKQKKFTDRVAKDFANVFTKQTAKLVKIIKIKEKKQKIILFWFFAPFNKLKL